ncbi:unnamed protein product, partial [Rotaria sp. Silwood1]
VPEGAYYERIFHLFPLLRVCHLRFWSHIQSTLDHQILLPLGKAFMPIQTSLLNVQSITLRDCSPDFLSHLLEHLPQLQELSFNLSTSWLPAQHPLMNGDNNRISGIDKHLAPNLRCLKITSKYDTHSVAPLDRLFERDLLTKQAPPGPYNYVHPNTHPTTAVVTRYLSTEPPSHDSVNYGYLFESPTGVNPNFSFDPQSTSVANPNMLLTKPAASRSDNYVNPNTRSTDAGASHYLPSEPPPHDRVNDDFPNESTTVDNDNYTSAIQTTAAASPNYGILITPPLPPHSINYDPSNNSSTGATVDNYSSTQPLPRDPIHDDDFPPEP